MRQRPLALTRKRGALKHRVSFIRTMTVGFGITPNLLTPQRQRPLRALAGLCSPWTAITAGGELHPALRTHARNRFRAWAF